MRGRLRVLTGVAVAAAVTLSVLPVSAANPPTTAVPTTAQTAAADPADRVPTPKPQWFRCLAGENGAQCATIEVPLDYDKPKGATTSVAVLRLRTADPQKRVGSLFVNPGGPGGSGVAFAASAPDYLSAEVLERFDIVGVDPRGTNFGDNVRCFKNFGQQADALAGLAAPFPYTRAETSATVSSARQVGRACSTTGRPLAGSMSTAAVARDMDLVRRAVGDRRLTYFGLSYGSYLGQVYANLFPQRVRAVAIDGVLDPVAWAGTDSTRNTPVTDRLRSGDGAWQALAEILDRCDEAGTETCDIAPDARGTLDDVVAGLRAEPVVVDDGELSFTLTYASFVGILLSDLYGADAWQWVVSDIAYARDLLAGGGSGERAEAASEMQAALDRSLLGSSSYEWPYDNGYEAFSGVLCTDSRNPASAWRWPSLAGSVEKRAPLFGRLWLWGAPQCAENTWTLRDEDAYRGPFTRRTAAPVLVVGNYWDPATNYQGAVRASQLLPNSRLLSSDSWGHTAYGTSACVTDAVDAYLMKGALPPTGTVCVGDEQPFQVSGRRRGPDRRPPIVPLVPGGVAG